MTQPKNYPPRGPAINLTCSAELKAAIDAARELAPRTGKNPPPRNPFIEELLWGLSAIRKGARAAGVKNPKRRKDSRGRPVRAGKKT